MFTKHTHAILAVIAALIGANAVSAGNDLQWHYDEDSDVYSFFGHPPAIGATDSSRQTAVIRSWHYDVETDTVVHSFADRSVEQATVIADMTE